MKRLLVLVVVGATALAALPGCAEPDGRVAEMAQQVTHEQAQQNQRIAEGSRAVAEGSKQLVEADAKARQELVGLQQDLRKDQADIGKQRDHLEEERQVIAGQRIQESRAGALWVGFAIILVCLAPLVLAGISLLALWKTPTPEEEREILVEELAGWLGQEISPDSPGLPAQISRTIGLPAEGPPQQS
jgi:TolA-binding protein